MNLSSRCAQLGRPACAKCTEADCSCPCHRGEAVASRPVPGEER